MEDREGAFVLVGGYVAVLHSEVPKYAGEHLALGGIVSRIEVDTTPAWSTRTTCRDPHLRQAHGSSPCPRSFIACDGPPFAASPESSDRRGMAARYDLTHRVKRVVYSIVGR